MESSMWGAWCGAWEGWQEAVVGLSFGGVANRLVAAAMRGGEDVRGGGRGRRWVEK